MARGLRGMQRHGSAETRAEGRGGRGGGHLASAVGSGGPETFFLRFVYQRPRKVGHGLLSISHRFHEQKLGGFHVGERANVWSTQQGRSPMWTSSGVAKALAPSGPRKHGVRTTGGQECSVEECQQRQRAKDWHGQLGGGGFCLCTSMELRYGLEQL